MDIHQLIATLLGGRPAETVSPFIAQMMRSMQQQATGTPVPTPTGTPEPPSPDGDSLTPGAAATPQPFATPVPAPPPTPTSGPTAQQLAPPTPTAVAAPTTPLSPPPIQYTPDPTQYGQTPLPASGVATQQPVDRWAQDVRSRGSMGIPGNTGNPNAVGVRDNGLANSQRFDSPIYALFEALGGADKGNPLMRAKLGEFAPFMQDMAQIIGLARGQDIRPEMIDMGGLSKEIVGGLMQGHLPDVTGAIKSVLDRAINGDGEALNLLGTMDPSQIANLMVEGEMMRGLVKPLAQARRNAIQRELMNYQIAQLGKGATNEAATADTQEWARLLARLSR